MTTTGKFRILGILKGFYFYLPIFTLYTLDQGIAISVVVFSQIFYSLTKSLGEMPTGLFADRFGQRLSIIIGYTLEAVGILSIVLFPSTMGLYACYAIGGLAAAFLSGSEEALLFEAAKKEKKKYTQEYGAFLSNQTFGMVLSAFVGGLAYQYLDTSAFVPLFIATVVSLFCAAGIAISVKNTRVLIQSPAEGSGLFAVLKKSAKVIRKDSTIFHLAIVAGLTITADYFLYSVYQPAFTAVNVPAIWFGAAMSVGAIINMILMRYVYILERYFTLDKIILWVSIIIALGYIVMATTQSAFGMVAAFILAQSLFGLEAPIVSDYINERVESSIRSTVLSGISFIERIANIFFRICLTVAVGWYGVSGGLLAQGGYLFIGALIGYWLLVRCGCVQRITKHNGVTISS